MSLDLVNQRIAAVPTERRVSMARYDARLDHLTLQGACQMPHELQRLMAKVFGIPETRIDVISPDGDGGFGMKSCVYPEDVTLLWAARKPGRDIAWVGDRSEGFQGDAGGRDHMAHGERALDAEHRFPGMRFSIAANMGLT